MSEETVEQNIDETAEETTEEQQDMFPRSYVEELRAENAKYRTRAKHADDLAHRLHTALVTATGRLEDPSDLAFDETHLDSQEALEEAIGELLERKPHLASRRLTGDIGQGVATTTGDVDLAGMLRSLA